MINRVISGGQTGADRAGLDAARALDIETGGWAPHRWKTESGPDPSLKHLGLVTTFDSDYQTRTAWNVRDSDATIVFARCWYSPGTRLTISEVASHGKLLKRIDIANKKIHPLDVAKWIIERKIYVLNVAGHRESKEPGIYQYVYDFLKETFEACK